MSDEVNNNDATRPMRVSPETPSASGQGEQPTQPVKFSPGQPEPGQNQQTEAPSNPPGKGAGEVVETEKPVKLWRGRLVFIAIALILIALGLGSELGYRQGINDRVMHKSSQVALAAATQFQLGLEDMAEQRYEMARGRFEYVIRLDPSFPGAKEKLAEVMVALLPTVIPTATLTPTPEFTPTPDMRGEEEIFNQIKKSLADKKWDVAIVSIESLRSKNLKYKTIEVDGFYFIALRYRGVDKILRQGDLEGGMYDLALVERFGPLDRDADSYRLYARYYVTGASFWQVDWEKATYYFGQVAPLLPNLRDASNQFAIDRYRQAAGKFAEDLFNKGDACRASKLLDTVFLNNYRNGTFEPIATRAYHDCYPATATSTPTPGTATPTSTPTGVLFTRTPGGPTLTPSPTGNGPAATPTGGPAATHTPTPTAAPGK